MAFTLTCHAHNRRGGRCGRPVVAGKRVCRLHGGKLRGPLRWYERTEQRKGIAARFERLRQARAAGLIEKLPGRPRGLKRQVEEMTKAMAEVVVPGVSSSLGEKLTELTGDSLAVMSEIVRRKKPYSDRAHKLKALQKDTAIAAVNAQLRVDENVLRARQQGERLAPVLGALLAAAGEEHDPAALAMPAVEPIEEIGFSPVETAIDKKPGDL